MSYCIGMVIAMFTGFAAISKACETEELRTFNALHVWFGDWGGAGAAFVGEDRTVRFVGRFVVSDSVFGKRSGGDGNHFLVCCQQQQIGFTDTN